MPANSSRPSRNTRQAIFAPFRALRQSFRRVKKRDQAIAVLLLWFWLTILLGNYLIPGSYVFEGSLTVSEMSFTHQGTNDRLFLNTIRGIKTFDLQGAQPKPITLTGKFSSKDNSALNQKLKKLTQIEIALPISSSRLILSPANQSNQLSLLELRLNPGAQVNQLTYNQPAQLSFCLQSSKLSPDACLVPESVPLDQTSTQSVGTVNLQLGREPLTVTLAQFKSSDLGTEGDAEEITFEFAPTIEAAQFSLYSPTQLFLDLPDLKQASKNRQTAPDLWIWRDLTVNNVRFFRFERTGNNKDELKVSTILQGEVRLGNQVMKVEPQQFLVMLSPTSGIHKINYIQIHPQAPTGLKTLFTGESKGVGVGLYPDSPVQKIEPRWLLKYISQEGINALLAVITAFTAIFLPRLFPEQPKTTDTEK